MGGGGEREEEEETGRTGDGGVVALSLFEFVDVSSKVKTFGFNKPVDSLGMTGFLSRNFNARQVQRGNSLQIVILICKMYAEIKVPKYTGQPRESGKKRRVTSNRRSTGGNEHVLFGVACALTSNV